VTDDRIISPQPESRQKGGYSEQEIVAERPVVLIVEADPSTRKLLAYFLEEAGYAVEFAADGYIALDRVRLIQPALLITEVYLPHLDGLTLCRLLKKDRATGGVPILVLSMLDAEELARESGADAFTKKPFEKQRLLHLVSWLIASKSLQEDS